MLDGICVTGPAMLLDGTGGGEGGFVDGIKTLLRVFSNDECAELFGGPENLENLIDSATIVDLSNIASPTSEEKAIMDYLGSESAVASTHTFQSPSGQNVIGLYPDRFSTYYSSFGSAIDVLFHELHHLDSNRTKATIPQVDSESKYTTETEEKCGQPQIESITSPIT
jgi:hypothetical protein